VERGLTPSRERAQALILAGKVLVNEQKVEKAGASIDSDAAVRLLGEDLRYVSRGGLKLEKALEHWRIDLDRRVCLDVGASTGGFTDCMLQHGAAKVVAVDTGYGQMDFRLRNDPRVRLLEKTNARYLTREDISEDVGFVAMDVSFISATLVLPAVIKAVSLNHEQRPRQIVVLVKPQFEVGRELVGKGGIVRDEGAQLDAVRKAQETLRALGAKKMESIESPILGSEGNREFLLYAEFVDKEVLPLVEKQYNVKLTKDPDGRATMGGSSGGSAALIMAWYHPELYHRVLTYSGTYVNQQWPANPETPHGAWEFHEHLIPNSPVKPIRLWMEVSDRDNLSTRDNYHDWVLANENMAKVLAAKGYHYQFVFARNAGHTDRAVKAQTLPEALEYVWQGYPKN